MTAIVQLCAAVSCQFLSCPHTHSHSTSVQSCAWGVQEVVSSQLTGFKLAVSTRTVSMLVLTPVREFPAQRSCATMSSEPKANNLGDREDLIMPCASVLSHLNPHFCGKVLQALSFIGCTALRNRVAAGSHLHLRGLSQI